jgi:hypothetical protein
MRSSLVSLALLIGPPGGGSEKLDGAHFRAQRRVRFAIFLINRHFVNNFKLLDKRTMPADIESEKARGALDQPVGIQ